MNMNQTKVTLKAKFNMDKTIKLFLTYIFAGILLALLIFLGAFYFYLYGSAIEREKSMLLTVVNSNTKLIEAVAKFDAIFSQEDDPDGAEGATLSQIKYFVSQFSTANPDYTIQLYKKVDNDLKLISYSPNLQNNFSENWSTQNNQLISSVFNSLSGTIISNGGLDNELIVAYSKVNVLDYAMLISVNLKAIREPYLHTLYIGSLYCILLSLIFGYIIRKKAQPVIEKLNSEIRKKTYALETLKKNEERLDIALSVNNDGIFDLDTDTLDVFFDDRFYSIAGYTPGDFPSKFEEWTKRIHPDDQLRIESTLKQFLAGAIEVFDVEYRFKKKDNNWMWLRSRVKIVNRNVSQQAKRIIGTNTDITERKIAETELRKNEENLKVTLNSIGDAVITTDINGNITRMNPVAEKLTGWSVSESFGQRLTTVFKIINAVTREVVSNPVEKVLASGEIVGLANHTMLIAKDGREFHIADSGAPIKTDSGPIIGVVLVFRDVTSDYMLQVQLRHSQKMDAVGQLASGVAHDFNNMLGGILMSAGLLNKHIGSKPEAQRPLKLICESAKHAADLTQKLLTFSRKENKETTQIDLHSVIRDTASLLETTLDKRIALTLNLSAENTYVLGDHALLQSCILNLSINASHAMPNGGEITLTTKNIYLDEEFCKQNPFQIKQGMFIQLEVKDTGTGIAPEYLTKIFEPFFTTKPQGQGTGLGLSTVFGTVQQHQGAISVSSIVNVGTTFQIYLPTIDVNIRLNDTQEYFPKKGDGLILFVDDESVFRETVKETFEDLGYKVMTAINGLNAIEIYEKSYYKIDLVILDMMMPGMNGLDCFIAMKKINPKVKAILATGYIKENDLETFKSEGINALIHKPYLSNELVKKVENVLHPS